jgi:tetratricopeptide (TPR) repeat protein
VRARARALSLLLLLLLSLSLSLSLARSLFFSQFRLGETFSHMGILYYQMKDYEKALVFYQLALDIRLNKLGV